MLEQDASSVKGAILTAQEHWEKVKFCLVHFFRIEPEDAQAKVRQVRERLAAIEPGKLASFNPLMEYHADPFDIAASLAEVYPGESTYISGLEEYKKSAISPHGWQRE
jgi:hypothetical protein